MDLSKSAYHSKLFPYAYNVLGSVEDARDVVQEVVMKHLTAEKSSIGDEKNYLIRSVINLAINVKARQKKMLRDGEQWLPEPIDTSNAADRQLHLNEILSYSLLVLMEQLSPTERAVFILKESFDYRHHEIATMLSITEVHSRQLLSRAKAALFKPKSRRTTNIRSQERDLLEGFLTAIRERDTQKLVDIMISDIQFQADGGGVVPAAVFHTVGAYEVSALEITVYHKYLTSAQMVVTEVNHQPALLSIVNGKLVSCQIFTIDLISQKILQISAVLDREKLKSFYKINQDAL
ncbi:MAG: sigma-70 family RNA polymerase sigma factor [Chryseolinea sp.]